MDGSPVVHVGEHKKNGRKLEKACRALVHRDGTKAKLGTASVNLVPHQADADVVALFLVFVHPPLHAKGHKFCVAVKRSKTSTVAEEQQSTASGDEGEREGFEVQAGTDLQMDALATTADEDD